MAQQHILGSSDGDVDVSGRVPREGWELTEKAEEGAIGSGTMVFDDPVMDFAPEDLRRYTVIETASEATDNVLFDGYLGEQIVSREAGDRKEPLARAWAVSVVDANSLWNRRIMRGSDTDRNAENDTTRMGWLLTTDEANFINDAASYVSTASPSGMDAVDYRGQYLNQIVDDASQHTGKNWWMQGQETGSGRVTVAWYGKDSLTAYASPLFLTNDLADVSLAEMKAGTSLVWFINKTAELSIDPSRVYTGVWLNYANNKAIYRRNPDVDDPDSPLYGIKRDFVANYPNVKTKAKAIVRADRLLADLANPHQVINCRVILPKGKATMIRAGMRVRFKATHMPGYETFVWVRVLTCTVSPIALGEKYRLSLELQGPGVAAPAPAPAVKWVYYSELGGGFQSSIEASDDGSNWHTVVDVATLAAGTDDPPMDGEPPIANAPGLVQLPDSEWSHRYWRVRYSLAFAGGFYSGITIGVFRLLSEPTFSAVCRLGTPSSGLSDWWSMATRPFSGDVPWVGVCSHALMVDPDIIGTAFTNADGRLGQASLKLNSTVMGAATITATWTFDIVGS